MAGQLGTLQTYHLRCSLNNIINALLYIYATSLHVCILYLDHSCQRRTISVEQDYFNIVRAHKYETVERVQCTFVSRYSLVLSISCMK